MTPIEFVEHKITARVPQMGNPTNTVEAPLTIRVDPLTGTTARLIQGARLAPTQRPDLSELTVRSGFCPFCADTIEQTTGTFPPEITDEGRIRRGQAAVVPNVTAYSEFSSVGLYDTNRHFVGLTELSPTLVGDLLTAFVAYTRGLHRLRPLWSSINANYLPPSGSSVAHPHAQSAHDDIGTSLQRRLVELSTVWPGQASYWRELLDAERDGPRWIGQRGRWSVLTPWAPIGFHEVWAVLDGESAIEKLTGDDCADLGSVLSGVFAGYDDLFLSSFNYALYGGGPQPTDRFSLLLRVVSRSNPDPMYRSDVTYFERLHGEAMIDVPPEQVAETMRAYLAG